MWHCRRQDGRGNPSLASSLWSGLNSLFLTLLPPSMEGRMGKWKKNDHVNLCPLCQLLSPLFNMSAAGHKDRESCGPGSSFSSSSSPATTNEQPTWVLHRVGKMMSCPFPQASQGQEIRKTDRPVSILGKTRKLAKELRKTCGNKGRVG